MERDNDIFPSQAHLPILQPFASKSSLPVSVVHRLGRCSFDKGGSAKAAPRVGRLFDMVTGAAVSAALDRTTLTFGQSGIAKQYAAVPWRMRDGFLEVMLVTSRRRGRWIVPKGWQVAGCTPSQSAEREAFEEAGVIGRAASEPIGSYRYSRPRDDGSLEQRHVTVFGLYVLETLLNWLEKGQRKRQWWPIAEACEVVDEPGLAELLKTLTSGSRKARPSASSDSAGRELRQRVPLRPRTESSVAAHAAGAR
jgi:8-oxo-dGTP pyrophosphatase MutT (NUDIX family)